MPQLLVFEPGPAEPVLVQEALAEQMAETALLMLRKNFPSSASKRTMRYYGTKKLYHFVEKVYSDVWTG